ncbi:MAG: CinA family protein [Bifidobacteriaceae bacterium]|jgi:nicotinamide-nucleotide amidase|nr:CinA family protein [Bifidobacteriaceae bacterium]
MLDIDNLVNKLIQKGLTISAAESFTGGLLADSFVKVSGASKTFLGSVVAYNKDIKYKVLGVSEEILQKYGVISQETALDMAKQAKKLFNSNIGISTTGVAGPDLQDNRSVGEIYIGLVSDNYEKTFYYKIDSSSEAIKDAPIKNARQFIRQTGVDKAMEIVYNYISGQN